MYSKSAGRFWYFDSMSSSAAVPAHAQAIATKLAPVVSASGTSSIEVSTRSTPRQTNGYDCGVYCLAIAEWLCLHVASAAGGGETTAAATDLTKVDSLTPSAISAKRMAISAIVRSLAGL